MADDRRPDAHDDERRASASGSAAAAVPGEPRRNWLRRIIGRGPAARRQLGEAVAALLGAALVALAAIGGLVIWHLVRRGRIIRERLGPPKIVRMPEPRDLEGGLHDDRHDAVPPA
jgi:hypothetical protein